MELGEILGDVFGNALGNSIVGAIERHSLKGAFNDFFGSKGQGATLERNAEAMRLLERAAQLYGGYDKIPESMARQFAEYTTGYLQALSDSGVATTDDLSTGWTLRNNRRCCGWWHVLRPRRRGGWSMQSSA